MGSRPIDQVETKSNLKKNLQKYNILQSLGLTPQNKSRLNQTLDTDQQLKTLLQLARIHCLNDTELYFLDDTTSQFTAPLNFRNEAAAISLLLRECTIPGHNSKLIPTLIDYCRTLWPEFTSGDINLTTTASSSSPPPSPPPPSPPPPPPSTSPPISPFEQWATNPTQGNITSSIKLSQFNNLRGCAATHDIQPGQVTLSIPTPTLIYQHTVNQTDLGKMLSAIASKANIDVENQLIMFTMIDRHDPDSQWALFWSSLPAKYYTGLSFPDHLREQLQGTAAYYEIDKAQKHIQAQYDATLPIFNMLVKAYPELLKEEWFSLEQYLWAVELWYSYAFAVEFPLDDDNNIEAVGKEKSNNNITNTNTKEEDPIEAAVYQAMLSHYYYYDKEEEQQQQQPHTPPSSSSPSYIYRDVMVPLACHINHSPWPHVVRYGRICPTTHRLNFPAFRPCLKDSQLYISYGPVPNVKLLTFYGFSVLNNPHDIVPLKLKLDNLSENENGNRNESDNVREKVVERYELSCDHSLRDGPLARSLLAYLRVVVATDDELIAMLGINNDDNDDDDVVVVVDPRGGMVNEENEEQAMKTLHQAVSGLLEEVEQSCERLRKSERSVGGGEVEVNENGLDDGWEGSRKQCLVYVEGQRKILKRSLEECGVVKER